MRSFVVPTCMILLFLAIPLSNVTCLPVVGIATAPSVVEAEEAMAQAYEAVLEAERAGADDSILLAQLNEAAGHLSKGRATNSTSELDEAIRLAGEVRSAAVELKDSAANQTLQTMIYYMIASILALALIAIGSILLWGFLKGRIAAKLASAKV